MNTTQYSTDEIRQAIEQGPITSEYRADPQQLIVELNRLRATEIASYLQYKQQPIWRSPCSLLVSNQTFKRMQI
jgi:hypothetical protein